MSKDTPKKRSSHLKAGLMAGALFGVAAGIFMSSKKGKQLAKDLKRHTQEIEQRLRKELANVKQIGLHEYEDAIDQVLAYYTKTRHIAKSEAPALRRYLVGRWNEVKKELEPERVTTKASSSSRKRRVTKKKK